MFDPRIFGAELDPRITTIDLHETKSVVEALDQLEKEIYQVFKKHVRHARIIHGIGEGILARAVHDALNKNPLIAEWHEEESGGSCIIIF